MRRLVPLVATLLVAACMPAGAPSPFDGQSRHLCCNLHYERDVVADVNFQQGTLVPLGTPVTITNVKKNKMTIAPTGYPPLTLVLKYGRRELAMDTYVNRLLVEGDPKAKLMRLPKKTREAIEAGRVEPGMTRDQVLMSLGYPPAHRTPSLEGPQWIYWQNRWQTFTVDFDGDRVDHVQR